MIKRGATHVGVATDHVIESFRNDLWPGYKTGAGIEPDLLAQFPIARRRALGARRRRLADGGVRGRRCAGGGGGDGGTAMRGSTRVFICTPDKDLAQCVRGTRVVQLESADDAVTRRGRRGREVRRPAGVDPRLPGAGRRRGRRLSRSAGLGREVDGCGARAGSRISNHIPDGLARVARQRRERGGAWR